jgi:hypothetical protein
MTGQNECKTKRRQQSAIRHASTSTITARPDALHDERDHRKRCDGEAAQEMSINPRAFDAVRFHEQKTARGGQHRSETSGEKYERGFEAKLTPTHRFDRFHRGGKQQERDWKV